MLLAIAPLATLAACGNSTAPGASGEYQISSVSDIQEMEFGLEIKVDNTTIDKPALALMLEKSDWEEPALNMPTSMAQYQAKESKKSIQQAYPFLTGPPKDLAETQIRWRSSERSSSLLSSPPSSLSLHSKKSHVFRG